MTVTTAADELATITAGQERVATITTGLEETATAQVTSTADGTTFTGMGEVALANIAEAEAHMVHLIAAYQLATSTSALRTETAQPQAGDQNTTIMSDDKSTISGCVKDTYAANEQAAISTIGSFGNATKQVPAVVSAVPSTNSSTSEPPLPPPASWLLSRHSPMCNLTPRTRRGICLQHQIATNHGNNI